MREEEYSKKSGFSWVSKTETGRDVIDGRIVSINDIFSRGIKIREAEIVDALVPEISTDVIFIGGSSGKGGGIRRTPSRRTARMHKSGRRFNVSVLAVVGNSDGVVGLGLGGGPPDRQREVKEKAITKAKLNVIPVRRGCGSWECNCGTRHSIPFSVSGKSGSVRVTLIPAPKGVGLVVSNEIKKIISLAGITDIWCRSRGKTSSRVNFAYAVFNALRGLGAVRTKEKVEKSAGIVGLDFHVEKK